MPGIDLRDSSLRVIFNDIDLSGACFREGGASYLIPVRLDDHIFRPDCAVDPAIVQTIRDRVVADFTNLDAHLTSSIVLFNT